MKSLNTVSGTASLLRWDNLVKFNFILDEEGEILEHFQIETESTELWDVEEVLDIRYTVNGTEYQIKWKDSDILTWEPKEHIKGCLAWRDWKIAHKAFITVKDMQKELPLPKLNPQPSDYYRKVNGTALLRRWDNLLILLIFNREN
jgi:hypothetical protein